MSVAGLAGRIAALRGWRRRVLAFGLGGLALTALPPLGALPVLIVSFAGLVWLMDGQRSLRAAFADGWWWGLGYFALGLYWIAFALLTDPARYGWMIPFAVGGLSAGLALYPALAVAATRATGLAGPGRVLALAVFWVGAEWLRGVLFTGFPWNPIGHVWLAALAPAQLAALGGVWSLGLLSVAAAAMPATLAEPGRAGRRATALAALAVAAVWAGGALRLDAAPPASGGARLRIVQPAIPQAHKWRDDLRAAQLVRHIRLSAPGPATPRLVIWPETAIPYFLDDNAALRRAVATALPKGGLLISGVPRTETSPGGVRRVWNSAEAIDASGRVVAAYDKAHLVPFGEYVPLRGLLRFAKITHGSIDFSRGPGPKTLHLPGLPPVGILICYEAIFPDAVTAGERPAWLLNLTNDAWFGDSAGPYEHFTSARMRAIEQGLPLVRAANTGISGVIDGYGRVVARLGLGRSGALDARLPPALDPTPYARYGDAIPLAFAAAMLALAVALRRGEASHRRPAR